MFIFKLNSRVKLRKIISSSTKRYFQSRISKSTGKPVVHKPKPIRMSFIAIESTDSYIGKPADPIIIMHGLFGSKLNWRTMSRFIHNNTKLKIISVDARNHGESAHSMTHSYDDLALDIKELMTEHSYQKATLLGHCMGGKAVMMFALKWPNMVDKLIVGDISPIPTVLSLRYGARALHAMRAVMLDKNISLSQARLQADVILAKGVHDKATRSFLLTNLVKKADGSISWRVNIPAIVANYQKISSFPKIVNLKYEGPTLFIGGGNSDAIPKKDHDAIRQLFPKAEFKSIPGAGHFLHAEKPAEFLKIVLEFLRVSNINK